MGAVGTAAGVSTLARLAARVRDSATQRLYDALAGQVSATQGRVLDGERVSQLERRGGQLSDRSARTIITELGEQVGLGDDPRGGGFGPHVLRHTFATQLLRGGADPVLVADLLGHASLGTLRLYTQPDDADRERALNLLTTDH